MTIHEPGDEALRPTNKPWQCMGCGTEIFTKDLIESHQKSCKKWQNKVKWTRIAREYFNYPDTMGSFYRTLCTAIQIADKENTAKLRTAFPDLVEALKDEYSGSSAEAAAADVEAPFILRQRREKEEDFR